MAESQILSVIRMWAAVAWADGVMSETEAESLGRLIRHRHDRGVLAVLDPRLRTMGYGRRFLQSLPPAPITHDVNALDRFFADA